MMNQEKIPQSWKRYECTGYTSKIFFTWLWRREPVPYEKVDSIQLVLILNKVKQRSRFLALWCVIMIITFIIILHVKDYSYLRGAPIQ